MAIKQKLEKTLLKFGKIASPTFVAMSIAIAKGIFRPAFTMADKKEDYETKRYTAIREGLTEFIAIPIYYLSGVVSKYAAKKLAVPKNFMSKDLYKKYKAGDKSKELLTAFETAKGLAEENLPKIGTTASFIGVGLSALILIPLVCSLAIKPIMKRLEKKGKKTTEPTVKTDVYNNQTVSSKPRKETFKSLYSSNVYGMKVGGV